MNCAYYETSFAQTIDRSASGCRLGVRSTIVSKNGAVDPIGKASVTGTRIGLDPYNSSKIPVLH